MNERPLVFIAFGITGDLMRLKILPALFGLYNKGQLPKEFRIIGVSRKAWGDGELRAYMQEIVPAADAVFLSLFYMLQGDVDESALYETLGAMLLQWEAERQKNLDCLFYLSVAPTLYEAAFKHLALYDWARARICIEKPFGQSGASAAALDTTLKKSFREEDIYRIDHYLFKPFAEEIVRASLMGVKSVHIRLWETIGVEKRGSYYDATGALRDVGQNHLLQMLALLALDKTKNTSDSLPERRAEIIEHLKTPSEEALARSVRAQYEGYTALSGVAPDSQTESYFKVETWLDMPGWERVPFTLESGKCLPEVRKEAVVTGMDGQELLFKDRGGAPEYELLLLTCMKGEKSHFVSWREVKAEWAFIDPIIEAWQRGVVPLTHYMPGMMPKGKK